MRSNEFTYDDDTEVDVPETTAPVSPPERSIRNIQVNRSQADRREVPPVGSGMPANSKSRSTIWLWLIAGALLLVVGILAIFLFRTTTITVTPRTQTIVFDQTKSITAYPENSATAGSLTYTVQNFDQEESEVVASSGTVHAERKASGTITLVNAYSAEPVKLIKSTRFQSPDGLIFRAPEDISIPGMQGSNPGSINVTVVADQVGDKYNIAPVSKFTLPGLKGGAMYDKVYARSSTAFSGGFSGNEPAVQDSIKSAAIAAMRARLQEKVLQDLKSKADLGTMFPSLAYVTFEDAPSTVESDTQVRLHEKIHVLVPVFPTDAFNRMLASTVSADAENSTISLIPGSGFDANIQSTSSTAYGSTPVTFSLAGSADLRWVVDSNALTAALAGKDQSAFQTIVNGFPSIQEARARIEPFWKHTFPNDATKIKIIVKEPVAGNTP